MAKWASQEDFKAYVGRDNLTSVGVSAGWQNIGSGSAGTLSGGVLGGLVAPASQPVAAGVFAQRDAIAKMICEWLDGSMLPDDMKIVLFPNTLAEEILRAGYKKD